VGQGKALNKKLWFRGWDATKWERIPGSSHHLLNEGDPSLAVILYPIELFGMYFYQNF